MCIGLLHGPGTPETLRSFKLKITFFAIKLEPIQEQAAFLIYIYNIYLRKDNKL